MVSLLRVLYILHISFCLHLGCLAGKYDNLRKYGFVVADLPNFVDLKDKDFAEITKDRNLMLDDDFMMNFFESLTNKIKPFKEYLTNMFYERYSFPFGSLVEEEKVYAYDFLLAELQFPTRK